MTLLQYLLVKSARQKSHTIPRTPDNSINIEADCKPIASKAREKIVQQRKQYTTDKLNVQLQNT